MNTPTRFRTLAPWLREEFGRSVYRLALDAGSTCPNRDGTRGWGGCTYCDVEGSGTGALRTGNELSKQLEAGFERLRRRSKDAGVIAYFQSYTNTYVDGSRLREMISVVEPHLFDPIVAVSVATRPDCLPQAALEVLAELRERVPVWIELGLETANDRVLLEINRLHTLAEFEDTARRAREADFMTVGHAILGLPGDGREGARETALALARSGVSGVKVHHLMVLKKTQLAAAWRRGEVEVLNETTYVQWLADFVERLHPDQVLHRITGDSPAEKLLAPRWPVHKNLVRGMLEAELARRETRQGSHALTATAPGSARSRPTQ